MSIRTKLNEQKPFISRRRLPREISRARRGHRSTRRGRETRPTVAVMSGVDVDAMSVGQLKQYLRDAGADTTGCLEKVRERRRSIDRRTRVLLPPAPVRPSSSSPRRRRAAHRRPVRPALLPLRPSPRSHRRWTSRGSRRECARPARARAARRAHPPRRLARPRTAITTRTRGDRRRRRSRRSSCLESCA